MRKVGLAAIAACCLAGQGAWAGNVVIIGGMQSGPQVAYATPSSLDGVEVSTRRQTVAFQSNLSPGSILIRTGERKLYFILADGQAVMYPVGVGREGFAWSGRNRISRKAVWPDWRPPKVMIAREAKRNRFIPEFMKGGPNNPLGARALYIGDTEFRIHGTTQPWSIGRAVSSGCIRMLNEEVIDLYARVEVGADVVVE
jgi:lipoprotein-anchoring transpeptidase ErfK/SrfK